MWISYIKEREYFPSVPLAHVVEYGSVSKAEDGHPCCGCSDHYPCCGCSDAAVGRGRARPRHVRLVALMRRFATTL